MRKLALFPLVLVCAPLHAQTLQLPPGIELQARIDGDLNGDAIDDIAYVAGNDEGRELAVLL